MKFGRYEKRFQHLVMIFLLAGIAATGTELFAKEGLNFAIGPQWMFLKDETAGEIYTMTFIPQGQTAENWQSMLEMVNASRNSYPKTVREAQKKLLDLRLKTCPDTNLEMIDEDKASIIFVMNSLNCPFPENRYQLTKILYGKKNVYILIFTQKSDATSQETRDQWIMVLKNASIRN